MSVQENITESTISVRELEGLGPLPLVIEPQTPIDWRRCFSDIRAVIDAQLESVGGVLLRGFNVEQESDFQDFAKAFGHELLSYDYASTPRSKVEGKVYTSTEYPAHQVIPLHNEQAYTLNWPMRIWFCSLEVAEEGGETPIADSRQIYNLIEPDVRNRFEQRKLMYVRNYGNGLDLPWQKAFSTDSKADVERFCQQNEIEFEWKGDGELRTRQVCQATARHPRTGESVWFNQAHLFHVSNLQAHVRETLISIVGEDNLPRNVYYGDGSAIDEKDLDHVRRVMDDCEVRFLWQKGDIMMLDNMLVAHARGTFKGDRKVVVAMAEPNR
ncbi:TauD/TfdA family dioxygenase [Marinomonas mediterranea]|uniref:TauD/TfdA family dioxygenase n=1 Tax=Marinomonas mediterranea TaxID=119864 RepID=UPI00234B0305|nr:TauD/TfdA family dioxygenase [Marinomonas mediterranea]WCN12348.1 TauD/TfdA family dioxygenase [Marinomonas mediterranea]